MPSVKDYKDILATVQLYVDGCNKGDPAIMEPAFDKQAVMFSHDENGKMVAEGSVTHLFDGPKGIGKETNSAWQIDVLDATPPSRWSGSWPRIGMELASSTTIPWPRPAKGGR